MATSMKWATILLVVAACVGDRDPELTRDQFSDTVQGATVCGAGATVKGIDVSTYQGTIDWAAVKGAGIEYAFIRVSDGLNSPDAKFASNWSKAHTAGVLRGAYQFFRPSQDPIAQADLLIHAMGTLASDDLSPVIDVEAADGLSATKVAAAVHTWIAHVQAATGRTPIVYTGFYFWRDSVGAADDTTSPLWHAQYTSASCPNIAPPWNQWAFWQYSSTGSVAGISGNVDMDRFNGTRADLLALAGPAIPCGQIAKEGGVVDDGDACFVGGGPSQYMRAVSTAGNDGDLRWTHATSDASEANFGEWSLDLAVAGTYRVEVYTAAAFAQSKQAKYGIDAGATHTDVVVDQTAVDGWQTLGDFDFAAGGDQRVHLGDNTGEPVADNVQLVFDAVRLTPVDRSGAPVDPGAPMDPTDPAKPSAGCSTGGGAGLGFGLGLLGLVSVCRPRRSARPASRR